MAILTFQKPDKVIMIEADDFHGKFEFRPLQQGYGMTIGNALRRVLISSLEGYAITSIKIEGVVQEFSSIQGVMEDVTQSGLAVARPLRVQKLREDILQRFFPVYQELLMLVFMLSQIIPRIGGVRWR